MSKIMTIRANDYLQSTLKKIAEEKGITRNALVLQILWGWIEEN